MSKPRVEHDAEVRRLRRSLGDDRRVVVLYGPPGAGKSSLARKLAGELGSDRRLPVHWLAIGVRRPTGLERLLLRLLLASGAPQTELRPALLSASEDLVNLAATACRDWFRAHPAVIVLDDLSEAADGEDLLGTVARLLDDTRCVLIATARLSRASGSDGSAVVRHRMDLTPEASRNLRSMERLAPVLLHTLATWEGAEFSLDIASPFVGLTPVWRRDVIEWAHREGMLQRPRPGWYELRPALHTRLTLTQPHDTLRSGSRRLDSGLARAVLNDPGELGDAAEPYVDLALRLGRSGESNSREFTTWLAHQLAREGALLPLLMLKSGLGHTIDNRDALTIPLAVAARQAGRPRAAAEALAGLNTPDAVRELAVTHHHMGQLTVAEATLDTLPTGVPDGWALHTRAAIRTDRGALQDVGRLLRLAIETHQVRGDRRGEAWAVFHYGRLRLMRGDLEEARKRLETAGHTFHEVGDVVGAAWTNTELCRVALLLNGPEPDVLLDLKTAPSAHQGQGDVRGEAWAILLQGVAYADAGLPGSSALVLNQALRFFESLPDRLGLAWTLHHLAWLTTDDRAASLLRVLNVFADTGCGTGPAWTLLQLAARPDSTARTRLDEARSRFEALGDTAGEHWVAVVRDGPGSHRGAQAIRALTNCFPRHVLKNTEWDDFDTVPLVVRHLLPEAAASAEGTWASDVSPAALVRLLLLDDFPTTGTAARVMLRVDPGPAHSGATSDAHLPPLTARATPLTHADVDPAHSVLVDRAAVFRFAAHLAGRHRIRFTIEDMQSDTVLQQVETEIDVTGTPGTDVAPFAIPHPETARRH
ncbi:AAA family ATPase [Streptomyces sp. MMS24-I2-30]|uniref:AAA family ATPase n=1 Tax=Streptomyces sp. MMS24-I2-30 TaxID=3351564 RepID=UPI003896BC56